MKKIVIALIFALSISVMQAQSLSDLLGKLGSKTTGSDTTKTTGTSLGSILGTVGNAVENLTQTSNFSIESLVGKWDYVSPAVSLSSDNLLSNIGGAAASSTLENQLSEYYNKFGLNKLHIEVDSVMNFTMNTGKVNLSGTVEKDGEQLIFNFKAFGKVNLGKIKARATMSGSNLNLTFEAKKLLELLTKVSSITNNSTLNNLNKLLSQYKDLYIGSKLRKS